MQGGLRFPPLALFILALLQFHSLHREKEKAKCFEFSFPGNEMALLCVHCVVDLNKTGGDNRAR